MFRLNPDPIPTISPVQRLALTLSLSAVCIVFMVALLAWQTQPAQAAPALRAADNVYVVNNTADLPDADVGDGLCAAANGACTLRAAIMQANFSTGVQTITIPSGAYTLTRTGEDDGAALGDLDITGDLVIQGAGANNTIIDGNGAVTIDRIFHVIPPNQVASSRYSLSGLTIRNGKRISTPYRGGGIYLIAPILVVDRCYSCVSLFLSDVILDGNAAGDVCSSDGGGLFAEGGRVFLTGVVFRANTACNGAGMWAEKMDALSIQSSVFYSNSAKLYGGALLLNSSNNFAIQWTEIYSNVADVGGGIYVTGYCCASDLTANRRLENSYLHDNHANEKGGAVNLDSSLVISTTVLEANTADHGGAIAFTAAGQGERQVLIDRSTLSRNTATNGGGIWYVSQDIYTKTTLLVQNSTLSGNSVTRDGGGIYMNGEARVWLSNATIAGNWTNRVSVLSPLGHGGGLYITGTAKITAQNTLIGDNMRINELPPFDSSAEDCYTGPNTSLRSLGFNLVETTTNCLISGTTVGNVYQDPLLGPLQNNGGPTPTRALLPGSPAIDGANLGGCRDAANQPLGIDQRGVPRPLFFLLGVCDIGAYEVVAGVSQAIDFPPIADKSLLTPFVVTATTTSGLTVTFSSNTPTVCSVSASSLRFGVTAATVSLLKTGTCVLVAQQPGNSTFGAAGPVTRTFRVSPSLFLPLVVR